MKNASEEVIRELLARLEDKDSNVRSSTASTLIRLGNTSEEVVRELLAQLKDKNDRVHYSAASTWGKFSKKSGDVVTAVAQWIEQHQDSEYVGNGIDALWYLVVGEQS